MAKLGRYTQLIFGSTAAPNQIAKFGSLAAGSPTRYSGATVTPALIQILSNYATGWFGAVLGGNSPAIEDWNAICYLFAYQLTYLFQAGVPEWDSATIYYIGSLANNAGVLYVSITDNNVNNVVTDTNNWKMYQNGQRTTTANDTATQNDDFIRANPTGGSFTQTLPAVASTPVGKRITVKTVGTSGNTVTVKGNGAELIDQANTIILGTLPTNDAATVRNNGTSWDII